MGISARAFLIHSLLFLATVLTLTLAGVQWLNKNPFELENFSLGVGYALLITVFLGAHEPRKRTAWRPLSPTFFLSLRF
jgi:hypothetical protein